MSASGQEVTPATRHAARECLRRNSRSFAFASKLFPSEVRDDAAVVYAFCRGADDAVDGVADPRLGRERLERIKDGLARAVQQLPQTDPVLEAFGTVLHRREIPLRAVEELLAGMEMDLAPTAYPDIDALLRYCYHAAGTVGWMMAGVLGVRGGPSLVSAVHLGIAMQLTNICRDVLEDWNQGRLYLPLDWLAEEGAPTLAEHVGHPFPDVAAAAVAATVRRLLALADRYYASGDTGLSFLPWRSALAIRTARRVYSAIGTELARVGYDVRAGRVVVSGVRKLLLLGGSLLAALAEFPARWRTRATRSLQGDLLDGSHPLRL